MSYRSIGCVVLLAVLASGCASSARRELASPASDGDSFAVIALPDTQFYSQKLPAAFVSQARWIVRSMKERNIQFVVGLGDVVDDGNSPDQWKNAMTALNLLKDAHVPVFLAAGNHDYSPPYWDASARPRSAAKFNKHLGPAFYKNQPSFAGTKDPGATENSYGLIRAGGRDFLVLVLEFTPRDSTLEWASGIVKAHPFHDVIVVTHSYLNNDGARVDRCARHNKGAYALTADNDGEEIWNKFAIRHPNVRLILSGHIAAPGPIRRFDVGAQGNLVNQMLSDYQDDPNAGNGWLRILTFHPSRNRIDVQTYSPYLEEHPELQTPAWKTESPHQFSIDFENPNPGHFKSGTIQGQVRVVKGNSVCEGVPGATIKFPGGSATSDAEGRFTAVVTGDSLNAARTYQSVELSVEKKGWKTVLRRATVKDGETNFEEILLKPSKLERLRRAVFGRPR